LSFSQQLTGAATPLVSGGQGPRAALRLPLNCWLHDKRQLGKPIWSEI